MALDARQLLGQSSRFQWSHLLIWATFGFMTLVLLVPEGYAFYIQYHDGGQYFTSSLVTSYRALFLGSEYSLLVSFVLLSAIIGIYGESLFVQFLNWIFRFQCKLCGTGLHVDEGRNAVKKKILSTSSNATIDTIKDLTTEEYWLLTRGGEEAVTRFSYDSFYVWFHEERKNLIVQELRFYYEVFQGMKGLFLLSSISYFFAAFIATVFSDLNTIVSNTVIFVILGTFFFVLFRAACTKRDGQRATFLRVEKALFVQWLELHSGGNVEVLTRDLQMSK